jgi:chemotaxis protein methyltransferase CheR
MNDAECIAFLQWALPCLERRWTGYRKVRGLVCKRLGKRLYALGLHDLGAYRARLEAYPEEWAELDALLGIPISRFYRDRGVFDLLQSQVLPALARAAIADARTALHCWSAGCASGEEPYTLAMLWRLCLQPLFPELEMRVVATDLDATLLERARAGCYRRSSLKELPRDLLAQAFEPRGDVLCMRAPLRTVQFVQQDLRTVMPEGSFDVVLCRNVILTYFAAPVQRQLVQRIASRLRIGGALVIGIHESLPEGVAGLAPWSGARSVYRRIADTSH